ncbi:hypothetical protein KUD11_12375 [Roseovarius sp. LXJ103]|uniref:hypothetical protein n=1 Tax=Roseovarius carneus TaxID=2853164 RepID=UPI000D609E20|nr:hypothetical protein [Roseovarius carneus]MBZ8119438.1 hypothetical protein [Roseovarius carneus]PWE34925.1 hypothetical protein DD563_02385 [Pelagicola sp. LXJ1103]
MKSNILCSAAALTLIAGAATAGGIQRDGDRSQILFEDGDNYVEFSATHVSPSVRSTSAVQGGPTPNIQESYQTFHLGYKRAVSDQITVALLVQEMVGADVSYPATGTGGALFQGGTATVDSMAVTGLVKYQFNDRFSAYGGLRVQSLQGNVSVPAIGNYALTVGNDYRAGYVLGAAYEIPDIALKVAFTYESEIEHEFRDNAGNPFKVAIPQAATLHLQSGVAQNTIVFGSARWQEWTEFQIAPADFALFPSPIASEPSDIWTYEIGVGHRFNESWAGSFTIGYEEDQGDIVGNLSGRDGFVSYGLGVKYSAETYDVSAGVKYIEIGDAVTSRAGSSFEGNDAIAFGVKMGFRF